MWGLKLRQETNARVGCIYTRGPPELHATLLDRRHRANVDSYIRTLLDFLVGHFFLVRGEQRRVTELADMFVM
jgi:hypothetical protein